MADPRSEVDRSGGLALVLTAVPDVDAAEGLVRNLLEERLVACGNIVPGLVSLYWREGKIAREGEVLVLLKVERVTLERVFGRIAELHPYEVPELVELPITGVSRSYGQWVMESTRMKA